MSLYIRLDKEINPQQLLQKLQNQINEHRKSNSLENSILCIDIKPTAHVIDNLVRKKATELLENQKIVYK